jgi:hypothetical protein
MGRKDSSKSRSKKDSIRISALARPRERATPLSPRDRGLSLASEKEIQSTILGIFEAAGWHVWRNNSGAFRVGDRFIRAGKRGSSDLIGQVPRSGRFLALEIKRPKGELSGDQREFLAKVAREGGVGVCLWAPTQAIALISTLTIDPWAKLDIIGDPISEKGEA